MSPEQARTFDGGACRSAVVRSAIRNKLLLRPERDFVQGFTGVLLGGAAVAIARLLDEVEFLGFELERHARHLARWGDLPRRGAIVAAIHP